MGEATPDHTEPGGGELDDDATGPSTRDRDVLRRMRRILLGLGLGVGALLALVVASIGGDGRGGLAVMLLMLAVACATAAGYGGIASLRDDLRDEPVARRRVVWVVGCFVAAAMLPTMLVGIGG